MSEDTAKQQEDMRKELEAELYRHPSELTRFQDGELWQNSRSQYFAIFPSLESAYEHLLEQKQLKALQTFVEKLATMKTSTPLHEGSDYYIQHAELEAIQQEAKQVLGWETE